MKEYKITGENQRAGSTLKAAGFVWNPATRAWYGREEHNNRLAKIARNSNKLGSVVISELDIPNCNPQED